MPKLCNISDLATVRHAKIHEIENLTHHKGSVHACLCFNSLLSKWCFYMSYKNILVFPSCMPRSIEYAFNVNNNGICAIGSSSIKNDPSKKDYADWFYLPLVSSADFLDRLGDALVKYDISGIYTPNSVVWGYLDENLQKLPISVELINTSPIEKDLLPFRQAEHFYHNYLNTKSNIPDSTKTAPMLPKMQVKSIFKHSECIPGMCDHEKLLALFSLARNCPKGDIVEIGTWWGKSAFILSQLAKLYKIGNVLCVDPWNDDELTQNTNLVDTASAQVSAAEAFDIFVTNLMPYGKNLNYLKMTSIKGSLFYKENRTVSSVEFGTTEYCGRISILHIDGNHSLESVKADISLWQNYLTENAWIIFDDYEWAYGNGPKIIGDDFLAKNKNRIVHSFVQGSALFINISSTRII